MPALSPTMEAGRLHIGFYKGAMDGFIKELSILHKVFHSSRAGMPSVRTAKSAETISASGVL